MKIFKELREAKKKSPTGELAFDSKVSGHRLMIYKENNKFVVYLDMEKLDTFKNLNDAKRAGKEFIKMAKG